MSRLEVADPHAVDEEDDLLERGAADAHIRLRGGPHADVQPEPRGEQLGDVRGTGAIDLGAGDDRRAAGAVAWHGEPGLDADGVEALCGLCDHGGGDAQQQDGDESVSDAHGSSGVHLARNEGSPPSRSQRMSADDRNVPPASDRAISREATPTAPTDVDPAAGVPVPPEMYPTEVDARGDAVETLREEGGLPPSGAKDEDRGASYA